MKSLKAQQLNVHEQFLSRFMKLSKHDILIWIKKVMDEHLNESYAKYNIEVYQFIDEALAGKNNVLEARKLAFEIHKSAKLKQNDDQFYLRALAHMVSTIHVKTHALKCCDYLIKYIQFRTKSNDIVVGERLRQITLLS